ncbi:excinuclease ABC subunit UvrC [Candidatus Woesearchaeota archaeon]|nr:excinuclease ABC subunit UvrC [Candidatus Woesearchaeota archaeon]
MTNIDMNLIPSNPGCYIYKDKSNKIIYIGKAKNLRKRVASYFSKNDHDKKTKQLISQIDDVDLILTDTETEALVLENNLIKKHQPKYNILLKDSARYGYIEITKEDFPKLIVSRKKEGGEKYGPFVSGEEREFIRNSSIKTFKIRTCNRLPKRACLRYHIGLCSAPCINNISKTKYNEDISSVRNVLKGKTEVLKKKLIVKMDDASKKLRFEQALTLKKQIEALSYLEERQKMERDKNYDEDIINFIIKDDKVYLVLFNVYKGILENKREFIIDFKHDFFEEFISRYYSSIIPPKEIILPINVSKTLKEYLEIQKGSKVRIVVPKRGEKKDLLELVKLNVKSIFFGRLERVEDLQKKLKLNFVPNRIECFDISHLGGKNTVASMVQFENGVPNKREYRKFKMKTFQGNDDFLGMVEVVRRRYLRLLQNNEKFPDLILIDGGKGQLGVAVNELKRIGVRIPIISLAKKFEEVFIPGKPSSIRLDLKSKASLLLREIRDEAHRFAVSYQRKLRKRDYMQ